MKCPLRFAILLFVLPAACTAQLTTSSDPTKSDPIAYLNRALDLMQGQALHRNTVDWPKTRASALAMTAHADSTVGTYDAIRFALASLGDHHSSLHLTPALEALEEQEKAKHRPPNPLPAKQENVSPYVGRYEPEGHIERLGNQFFGYIVLTKCFPEDDREFVVFETKVQRILAELDQSHPAGWIVDLRGSGWEHVADAGWNRSPAGRG